MVGGLEAIFLANRGALLRFVRARGEKNAEDVVQDLWLKLSTVPAEPIAEPLAYLYRMANNLMLDRRRSELSRAAREREWSDAAELADQGASDAASSERIILAREEVRAVERALSALGETTEAIFRRFRLEGVGQQQIAREMGLSLSAVEKHLQKAYRALLELRSRSNAD